MTYIQYIPQSCIKKQCLSTRQQQYPSTIQQYTRWSESFSRIILKLIYQSLQSNPYGRTNLKLYQPHNKHSKPQNSRPTVSSYIVVTTSNTDDKASYGKGKAIPLQPWTVPYGAKKLKHTEVVRLSTQGIDRLYPPRDIPGKHFCYRLSGTHGYSAAIPMATSVIEPATFRFTAQCLNQLRCRVPQASYGALLKPLKKIKGSCF